MISFYEDQYGSYAKNASDGGKEATVIDWTRVATTEVMRNGQTLGILKTKQDV